MGYEHGQYLKLANDVPLSNLFVTIKKEWGKRLTHLQTAQER